MEPNKQKLTRLKQVVYAMENSTWRPRRLYDKGYLRKLLDGVDYNLIPNELKLRIATLLLEDK